LSNSHRSEDVMINRLVAYIIKDQKPLMMAPTDTVQEACKAMWGRRSGSVLVVDGQRCLLGIFTGRDAVRLIGGGGDPAAIPLETAMTRNPYVVSPDHKAIDALRLMSDGGFRHVPVVENGRVWGVVSRGDLKGMEIDRLEEEEHLAECIR
jgi:CBS domain-containing protein